MQATRRLLSALLVCGLCFLLPGCNPGVVSDQALKDRFSQNRADYDELARLYGPQLEPRPSQGWEDRGLPGLPDDPATRKKINGLLEKLHVKDITSYQPNEIDIQVHDSFGWAYTFVYRADGTEPSPPKGGVVPSLQEKTREGTPWGIYYMRLDGNWYASVMEDSEL